MHTIFSFFNSIVLLGAVQGFIVSYLLFFSKKPALSNKILSAIIFCLAWASLKIYLNSQDWFASSTVCSLIAAFVPFYIVMPVGPLIFFYVRAFNNADFKISSKERRHFYPVIIDLVPHITAIIYVIGLMTNVFTKSSSWGNFIDSYYVYSDIPRWISISCYLWLSVKNLSSQKTKSNSKGEEQPEGYKWLRSLVRVMIIFQAIWLLHLVPYVIPRFSGLLIDTVDWFPIYIPVTILIYWLGIKGYIMAYSQRASVSRKPGALLSTLSASAIEQAVVLLQRSMEEQKLYLDPTLNLGSLSSHTGLPQKTISSVLNQYLHKSFNEFINGYRIEALKKRMQQPDLDRLTIAGIAFECGFNSQATFQRTFKEFTGMSPSEFRKTSVVPSY